MERDGRRVEIKKESDERGERETAVKKEQEELEPRGVCVWTPIRRYVVTSVSVAAGCRVTWPLVACDMESHRILQTGTSTADGRASDCQGSRHKTGRP